MLAFAKSRIKRLLGSRGYVVLRQERYAALLAARAAPPDRRSLFFHRVLEDQSSVSLAESARVVPGDDELHYCERAVAAFHRSIAAGSEPPGPGGQDVWHYSAATVHAEFIALLMKRDIRRLADILCNMSGHAITHGLSIGEEAHQLLKLGPDSGRHFAAYVWDRLLALNEAIGTVAVENPEQGPWEESCGIGVDELVARAGRHFGFSIVPALDDGMYLGLRTAHGILSTRDLFALYAAHRLQRLSVLPGGAGEICEIGSGIGRLIHYLHRLGCPRVHSYDLPYVQVLAGFETLKSLKGEQVSLFGEAEAGARVVFKPHFLFGAEREHRFAVTVNQDSMPEIDAGAVACYLRDLRLGTRYFVSINHESAPMGHYGVRQNNVSAMARDTEGVRLLSRDRFWLREGYVEEVYTTA